MLIQAPNYYRPPGWDEFDKRATIAGTTPYFSRAADVNRFGARYRLARAFKGLDLDGYSVETKIGYEALTKVTLHWSAFEQLKKSINMEDTRELVKDYNFSILAKNLRAIDINPLVSMIAIGKYSQVLQSLQLATDDINLYLSNNI